MAYFAPAQQLPSLPARESHLLSSHFTFFFFLHPDFAAKLKCTS